MNKSRKIFELILLTIYQFVALFYSYCQLQLFIKQGELLATVKQQNRVKGEVMLDIYTDKPIYFSRTFMAVLDKERTA